MAKMAIPEKYTALDERAKNGSRKAAIRLQCLQCVGYDTKEVRACTATDCPLYRYREKGESASRVLPTLGLAGSARSRNRASDSSQMELLSALYAGAEIFLHLDTPPRPQIQLPHGCIRGRFNCRRRARRRTARDHRTNVILPCAMRPPTSKRER